MRDTLKRYAMLLCLGLLAICGPVQAEETGGMPPPPSPKVTISPGYTSVGVNGTVQYTATVTGLAKKHVTWYVSGKHGGGPVNGTISKTGLYTAPAKIPKNGVTISALASDGKTQAIVYVNVAPPGPPISAVSPSPIPVGTRSITVSGTGFVKDAIIRLNDVSLTTTFINSTTLTASEYTGAAGSGVVRVMNPGSLWSDGYTVTFTGSTGSGDNRQTISPASASLKLTATQQFTSAGATSWSATAGTITSNGFYTAPSTMPASSTVTVSATGPKGTANATVTLVSGTPQTVAPSSASLALGATQQFTSSGATSWSATAGSISASGLYTAPAAMPASNSVTVSAQGPNGTGNATVTLIPPTPVISSVGNANLPLGSFTTTLSGSGFIAQSVARLNGSALTTAYANGQLTVSGYAAQSGTANFTVSNYNVTSQPYAVQVGVANAQVTAAAARRFLQQAAFGPTPSDAAHVQQVGFQGWLSEQYAGAQVSNYDSVTGSQGGLPAHFMTNAVSNADQLRQRVAFALSQIFVISLNKLIWNDNMVLYQDMLLKDAFGNYRQIMEDVTLSPGMGQFLDMANNAKANPAAGSLANENYARELMQLFTIGTSVLASDGTVQYDSNHVPVPTYTQPTIAEFARVFTGWTYAPDPGKPVQWGAYITSNGPMVPYPAQHDSGSKQLLNGAVAPSGLTPQQDLDFALDNIFNHANVGPFVGKQLIQHLVKSNPSPAYIGRVAAAFNDNGHGVRGDMQAVINAVLLDSEARANDEGGADQATDGHLQEPALFIAGMVRAFGGQMNDQNYWPSELAALNQDLFDAPSVFNYYSPNYRVPGSGGLSGGEFQLDTPNNAIVRDNLVAGLMFSQYQKPVQSYGPGTTVDLTPFVQLASNPATLVDALDLTLTRGVMPSSMKQALVTAVTNDGSGNVHRVQMAAYLILSSSYYNVWH
ncbi:MAG TPA: DUF1800 family protein [Nevskiaceae bacterium]|nr:DUF1800 family protein [Nevskiaceae bacterium]